MIWFDLSTNARDWMGELGGFGPTVHAGNREVKGCTLGADGEPGKTYWSSEDLRKIAAACNEVANWLDKRAEEVKEPTNG